MKHRDFREMQRRRRQAGAGLGPPPPVTELPPALSIAPKHIQSIAFMSKATGLEPDAILNTMLSIAGTTLNLIKAAWPIVGAMLMAEAAQGLPESLPQQTQAGAATPADPPEPPPCSSCRGIGVIRISGNKVVDCPTCGGKPDSERPTEEAPKTPVSEESADAAGALAEEAYQRKHPSIIENVTKPGETVS